MSSRTRRQLTACAAVVALTGGLLTAPAAADTADDGPVEAAITVPRVEGMGEDWINGADFSSILSLEESGVTFQDSSGAEADLFEVLADAEINWARVRVWNEPYRAENSEHGYGAGNVDADRATEIGVRATEAGMRVLVNFHYSDFWAHPGQQRVPRSWAETSPEERVEALYDYTVETLEQMAAAGVDIGMVQIGNETTSGEIAGTQGWDNTADLFSAGSQAVRDTLGEDVKVAVHFTNPERSGQYASVAAALDERDVDYDVFLSSYYAFWHGSLENLTSVLDHVATTYDKEVAVAETSWAYTLEDGDGMENAVASVNNPAYSISEQGQALAIRDVMQAVANVSDGRGLGTFYWEPAWIPVTVPEDGADRGELFWENWPTWQEHGSGWATSYAQDFYRPDPGWYEGIPEDDWADVYGGSGWDNQALFDWAGNPLESLRVYEYARTGSVAPPELDGIESPSMTVVFGEPIELPETVRVSYTDGTTESQAVTWSDSTDWILGPGTYTVRGTTDGGYDVTATITVLSDADQGANTVVNPGFEDGAEPWVGSGEGYTISSSSDPYEGSRSLHFWHGSDYSFTVEQQLTGLTPGEYRLSAVAQGGDAGQSDHLRITAQSGISTVAADFSLRGFVNWQYPVTEPITVGADGTATIRAELSLSGDAWGSMDNFAFVEVAEEEPADLEALRDLVAQAEAVSREDYTEESLASLDTALMRAAFVLGSASPGQQSVDGAVGQLQEALEGLELIPSESEPTPEPTEPEPTEPPGGDEGSGDDVGGDDTGGDDAGDGTGDDAGGSGGGSDAAGDDGASGSDFAPGGLPNTGAQVLTWAAVAALLLGLGALALFTVRRRSGPRS